MFYALLGDSLSHVPRAFRCLQYGKTGAEKLGVSLGMGLGIPLVGFHKKAW